jgi:hypothetical protein
LKVNVKYKDDNDFYQRRKAMETGGWQIVDKIIRENCIDVVWRNKEPDYDPPIIKRAT